MCTKSYPVNDVYYLSPGLVKWERAVIALLLFPVSDKPGCRKFMQTSGASGA